jgi:hypothetical protein
MAMEVQNSHSGMANHLWINFSKKISASSPGNCNSPYFLIARAGQRRLIMLSGICWVAFNKQLLCGFNVHIDFENQLF